MCYNAGPMENKPASHEAKHGYIVGAAPKKNLIEEFACRFRETFFHDDPLYHYKDQPKRKQFWLGLQSLFPILEWGRQYKLKTFKGDLIAGLTIASLCIPQVYQEYLKNHLAFNILTLLHIYSLICTHMQSFQFTYRHEKYFSKNVITTDIVR